LLRRILFALVKPSESTSSIEFPVRENKTVIFNRDGNVVLKTPDDCPITSFSLFTITGPLINTG
jgi:hypothetical protein